MRASRSAFSSAGSSLSVTGNFAKYVASIYNTIADGGSAAGNAKNYLYFYRGPSINATSPTVPTAEVIDQVLKWVEANRASLALVQTPTIPGLTPRVGDDLSSPYTYEYSSGVSRSLPRGSVRIDGMFRDYKNFYASVIDAWTLRAMRLNAPEKRTSIAAMP